MLWKGTLESKTQQQYNHNGTMLNTCETDWTTTIAIGLSASVAGYAGSASDAMTSNNEIVSSQIGDCAALPADMQHKPAAKLCG